MWNLLFYVKADQPRREYNYCVRQVFLPLFAARQALIDANVNVRVQGKRRLAVYEERQYSTSLGLSWVYEGREYFSGTRRFDLEAHESLEAVSAAEKACVHVPEMASSRAIADFVTWALQGPHKEALTCLVMWGHGGGWISPFVDAKGQPDTDPEPLDQLRQKMEKDARERDVPQRTVSGAFMTLPELSVGLAKGLIDAERVDRRIEIILFDSCLMACIEAAYQLRMVARYLVASQDLNPFLRWSHGEWLAALAENGDLPVDELLVRMMEAYGAERDFSTAVSAVDLDAVEPIVEAVKVFVDLLSRERGTGETWAQVAEARAQTAQFGYSNSPADVLAVDLQRFFALVAALVVDSDIRYAASAIVARLDAAVVHSRRSPNRRASKHAANGLSIFFPATRGEFERLRYGARYRPNGKESGAFVKRSGWFDFLESFWSRTRRA